MPIFSTLFNLNPLAFWFLIIAGICLPRLGNVPALWGFGLVALGVGLSFITSIEVIIRLLAGWGPFANKVKLTAFVVSAAGAWFAISGRSYPPINDITTDLEEVPEFKAATRLAANKGRDMTYPENFKSTVSQHYGDLGNLTLPVSTQEAFARAQAVAKNMGMRITHDDQDSGVIEFSHRDGLFGFIDDVVVVIKGHPQGSTIAMRSKSRDGISDLGKNAARIREFMTKMDHHKL